MGRFVMRKDREDQHCDLKVVLSKIAQGRNLQNPKLQAQIVINKLFRRIEDHRSTIAGARHYEHFVETCKAEIQAKENADQWLCYVIRLTNNKRTIGRRRGSAPRTTLALAIKDAATIANVSQLTPVEQRAFAILKGARRPTKSTKHPIERRALQLAKAVEVEWFIIPSKIGRPKGKWKRKSESYQINRDQSFDALKPLLTVFDVVSIAVPVIEDLAQCRIARRGAAFEALYCTVRAYSELIARDRPITRDLRVSQKTVQQALSRVRRDLPDLSGELPSGP
jgi:hypothetical protein